MFSSSLRIERVCRSQSLRTRLQNRLLPWKTSWDVDWVVRLALRKLQLFPVSKPTTDYQSYGDVLEWGNLYKGPLQKMTHPLVTCCQCLVYLKQLSVWCPRRKNPKRRTARVSALLGPTRKEPNTLPFLPLLRHFKWIRTGHTFVPFRALGGLGFMTKSGNICCLVQSLGWLGGGPKLQTHKGWRRCHSRFSPSPDHWKSKGLLLAQPRQLLTLFPQKVGLCPDLGRSWEMRKATISRKGLHSANCGRGVVIS